MPTAFETSMTRMNLMRAFAGESQARNRYTFAANLAKKQENHVLERVFLFTASQEEQHAKLFYYKLEPLAGQTIQIDGTYPVDHFPELLGHLRAAQHNEYQEWDHDYAGFARQAKEEGFDEIGRLFSGIAAIEKTHGDRFGQFADLLEQGKLFVSETKCQWMCLKCGHVMEGNAAPAICPVCRHPQGYFVRREMAP